MKAWTYITTNKKDGVLYTGVTNNLQRRVYEHKAGRGSGFRRRLYLCAAGFDPLGRGYRADGR
mgnify:CR=1 FL=1